MGTGGFVIDDRRIKSMRERLGAASKLVQDDAYLPMFRNRQINNPDVFNFSVKLAKRKRNPAKYFAAIWSKKNLRKTVDWIRKMINRAKSKAAEARHAMNQQARLDSERSNQNTKGREKLKKMMRDHRLLS